MGHIRNSRNCMNLDGHGFRRSEFQWCKKSFPVHSDHSAWMFSLLCFVQVLNGPTHVLGEADVSSISRQIRWTSYRCGGSLSDGFGTTRFEHAFGNYHIVSSHAHWEWIRKPVKGSFALSIDVFGVFATGYQRFFGVAQPKLKVLLWRSPLGHLQQSKGWAEPCHFSVACPDVQRPKSNSWHQCGAWSWRQFEGFLWDTDGQHSLTRYSPWLHEGPHWESDQAASECKWETSLSTKRAHQHEAGECTGPGGLFAFPAWMVCSGAGWSVATHQGTSCACSCFGCPSSEAVAALIAAFGHFFLLAHWCQSHWAEMQLQCSCTNGPALQWIIFLTFCLGKCLPPNSCMATSKAFLAWNRKEEWSVFVSSWQMLCHMSFLALGLSKMQILGFGDNVWKVSCCNIFLQFVDPPYGQSRCMILNFRWAMLIKLANPRIASLSFKPWCKRFTTKTSWWSAFRLFWLISCLWTRPGP